VLDGDNAGVGEYATYDVGASVGVRVGSSGTMTVPTPLLQVLNPVEHDVTAGVGEGAAVPGSKCMTAPSGTPMPVPEFTSLHASSCVKGYPETDGADDAVPLLV